MVFKLFLILLLDKWRNQWKIGKISVILKKGDPDLFTTYRPNSVTC